MVTDIKVFVEGLQVNTTLTELDFSRNDISDKLGLAKGLDESFKVNMIFSCTCISFLFAIGQLGSYLDIKKAISEYLKSCSHMWFV